MSPKKFDVREHKLVPKHERVPLPEATEILKELGLDPTQLPQIRASDPVVKAIGAKPGELVRIIRESETAGKTVVYRIVVVG